MTRRHQIPQNIIEKIHITWPAPEMTVNGQTKIYKSLKAVKSDVQKIDKNPVIQHHGK